MSCSRERLLSAEGGAERAEAEQDSPEEERALLGGLQRTVGRFSSRLLALGAGAGTAGAEYLKRMLATPEGTQQIYARLQDHVESPEFLEKVQRQSHHAGEDAEEDEENVTAYVAEAFNVMSDEWWDACRAPASGQPEDTSAGVAASANAAAASETDEEESSYVMVEKEDVIDALATFIAGYILEHPKAASMTPEQIQKNLGAAFGDLRRGTAVRLWDWSRGIYRCGAWTYTVVNSVRAVANPWVLRAVMAALWTSARITCSVGSSLL